MWFQTYGVLYEQNHVTGRPYDPLGSPYTSQTSYKRPLMTPSQPKHKNIPPSNEWGRAKRGSRESSIKAQILLDDPVV